MPTPPLDPQLAEAIRRADRLSRRRFLTRSGLVVGGLVLGPSLIAACGGGDDGESSSTEGGGGGGGGKELKISNWDAYIDEVDGDVKAAGTTIARFEEETGITVDYRKDYNDNDDYFNRVLQPNLGTGKPIDPDIIVPTYWMAARIIGLDWVEELPLDQIPNHANLVDSYLDLAWDPGATKHMPWQAGITGIAYSKSKAGFELKSVNDLFDDRLDGAVGMLTEMRDSVGLMMLAAGADPAVKDMDASLAAVEAIEQMKSDGKILAFTGNEYLRSLENGDFAACVAWSGDIAQLGNDDIAFVIPDEGGMQWFDTMQLPKGLTNVDSAAAWMDFVYDPVNAATITEYVGFVSPVKGVQEELEGRGGDAAALAENPILFPDDATLARLRVFADLTPDEDIELQTAFNEITA